MAFQEAHEPDAFAIRRDSALCKEGSSVDPPLVHVINHPVRIFSPALQII
jgi:hypothetical protein